MMSKGALEQGGGRVYQIFTLKQIVEEAREKKRRVGLIGKLSGRC